MIGITNKYCFIFLLLYQGLLFAQNPKHQPLFIESREINTKGPTVKKTSVKCVVLDDIKLLPVDCAPIITDERTGSRIEAHKLDSGEFDVYIEKDKVYKVECSASGYKPFSKAINISKEARGEDNKFQITLSPLVKKISIKCEIIDEVKITPIDFMPTIIDELTGKKVDMKKLSNGVYELYVEKDKFYKVECNALGYKPYDKPLNISKEAQGEDNRFRIPLTPLKAGESFILKNIYFHPNTPVFKSESNKELQNLFKFMATNTEAVISIEGHTNSNRYIRWEKRRAEMGHKWAFHGTAKKLSKKRAGEVKEFLSKKGVESKRIKTKGWGGDKELYPDPKNFSESLKNMRVEVHIIKI